MHELLFCIDSPFPSKKPLGFVLTVIAGKTDNVTANTHVTQDAITQIYKKKENPVKHLL